MDLPSGRTVGVRWRTILQFGDSWNVIGNVVMKNPGSARVAKGETSSITDIFLTQELREFDPEDNNAWYEFRPDATMHSIKDLFARRYSISSQELNGIIQIFINHAQHKGDHHQSRHNDRLCGQPSILFPHTKTPLFSSLSGEYLGIHTGKSSLSIHIICPVIFQLSLICRLRSALPFDFPYKSIARTESLCYTERQ
jgi:hypothetical protein